MAKIGQNWRKFAKFSEKFAIFANFDFGGPNGHLRPTKIQKSKKAAGFLPPVHYFLPPAQLLPPHHLLPPHPEYLRYHDDEHDDDQQCSPTVQCHMYSTVECSVQYVLIMMMMMCCAQHSTAVKSIGSIISRGSIIAVLPLFLIFARNGWNYHSGAGGITTCRFF